MLDPNRENALVAVMLCGDVGVGKTSMLRCFVDGPGAEPPSGDQEPVKKKKVEVDGETVTVDVWDSAGEERFRGVTVSAYRMAEGFIIVFDLSDEDTFESITNWNTEITSFCGKEKYVKVVVGNKSDKKRAVSQEAGEEGARKINAIYMEACAKTGEGVEEAFATLRDGILKIHREQEAISERAKKEAKKASRANQQASSSKNNTKGKDSKNSKNLTKNGTKKKCIVM